MRALRSRTVQADSTGSSLSNPEDASNTEKVLKQKKGKRHAKKFKKKKDTSHQSQSSEQSDVSSTRNNTKENSSPNIIKDNVRKIKNKKKRQNHEESVEFMKIVTPTAKKPIITRRTRSRISDDKNNSFETTFKNVITSTTMKPKKQIEDDIINISDSIVAETETTDVLNNTFTKTDETSSVLTTNNSGQWKIEELKKTPPTNKKVLFQEKSLVKSARKKWERFARNSQGANSILEEISTPRKKSPTATTRVSSNVSQKLNKTGTQSTNKIKRTVMPNFALIHQKAFEKMESISDYSQRKKDRANLLLSATKKITETEAGNKVKSSRQLFSQEKPSLVVKQPDKLDKKFNRFGFKAKIQQPSIHNRQEIVAIANKTQNTNGGKIRDNKRDVLKGVRTNRRFELLMKMRNN